MKLPVTCPSCQERLNVSKMVCESCQTEVHGHYQLPFFMQLATDEQEFIIDFLLSSGSLKDMASKLAKSYPTVRNKLDDLIIKIKELSDE